MNPFTQIIHKGHPAQFVVLDHFDEDEMSKWIRGWIEDNHKDYHEVLSPMLFIFDLSRRKLKTDDYAPTMLRDYAESEFIEIEWVGVLDELHRTADHHYINHPWYGYHVSEI